MPSKRRKHFVRPPSEGALTRAQALEIGRQLFDAITAYRLDPDRRDTTEGEDQDGSAGPIDPAPDGRPADG